MMPKWPQLFHLTKINQTQMKVSILNTFSKVYEKVIKDQLVSGLDKYLSPFISAYRKGYSTQHVLTRLVEEWRERLDNNYIVGTILMDLSKAFDCISHDLIIGGLQHRCYSLEINFLLFKESKIMCPYKQHI